MIDALKSAVDVTLEPRDHARLLERVGWLEILRSRYDEGQATLASAVDAYLALGDRDRRRPGRRISRRGLRVGGPDRLRGRGRALRPRGRRGPCRQRSAWSATRDRSRPARPPPCTPRRSDGSRSATTTWPRPSAGAIVPSHSRSRLRLDEIVAMALVTKGSALAFSNNRREGLALSRNDLDAVP